MLLAVDTSTKIIGVALYDGSRVLGETVWASDDYHTVELAPAVTEIVARAGLQIKDIQALGVAIGPGSFTGLRIGLALVKGLALARRLPLIGIRTLDFLAAAQPIREEPLVAVLRVGRGRIAAGWYAARDGTWRPTGEIKILTIEALAESIQTPTLVSGEMTAEDRQFLSRKRKQILLASPALSLRRPSFLAELAWRRWTSGQVDDPVSLSPIYLQLKDPLVG